MSSTSQVSGRSHGIVRRASSPQAPSSPSSSPAKTIGTPGSVIWSPSPTSCRSREPATDAEAGGVVAVEQVPGMEDRLPRDAGAKVRIVAVTACPPSRGSPTGVPQK